MFERFILENVRVVTKNGGEFLIQLDNPSRDYNGKGTQLKNNTITDQEIINFVFSIEDNEATTFVFPISDIIIRKLTNSETVKIMETLSAIRTKLKDLLTK
jgi:hypothetical protein